MLVLYAVPVSNYCATVRLLLRLKAVPFEERLPPDGYGSAAYKQLVPTGTVPAIVDSDVVLSESAVIADYLEERNPALSLLPAGPPAVRARVRWLARLHDTRVEPPLRALFAQMDPAARDAAAVERDWGLLVERLEVLAAASGPGPWLVGDTPTLADYAYPATLLLGERMGCQLDLRSPVPTTLADWWARLRRFPEVARELDTYGQAVDAWLERKRGRA